MHIPARPSSLPFLACLLLTLLAVTLACAMPGFIPMPGVTPALPTRLPTSLPNAQPSQVSPPEATRPPQPDQAPPVEPSTHYTLLVQFDYYRHSLSVAEQVRYTNHSGEALPSLVMVFRPARLPDNYMIHSLAWLDGTAIQDYRLEEHRLTIPLPTPLEPGSSLEFTLDYDLLLPETPPPEQNPRPLPYGYTTMQTNLSDWYAFLPPYRPGKGWLVHEATTIGEYLVYDEADFHVEISLVQPIPELEIAASAPLSRQGERYVFDLPQARSFAWSASDQYQVLSAWVGEVQVFSYAFSFHSAAQQQVLQDTLRAVELYTRLFGPYSHASLSAVEADFLDGMEFSGLYFLSRGFYDLYDGTPRGYLTTIAVHETAHQWWYDRVGNDQAREPWLDEALCTYSERLYYENVFPDMVDWWWFFRVNLYEPGGWVNGSIYDYGSYREYRDSVYLHGAQFLEDLRLRMGDEAFLAFLAAYASRMAGKTAGAGDFFAILSEYNSSDISDLQDLYFLP